MKTRSRSKMEEEVDRLSNLPQDILHQIFSEFDIKEVASTTCVLSKIWRYFWTSHPYISFTSDPTQNLDVFVSHVLSLHRSCKVNSFFVPDFGSSRKPHILSWVRFAVERGVEKLHLQSSIPDFDSLVLPTPLFTSKTLTVLQLGLNISSKGPRVELPLPKSINLPCLQELSLQGMARLNTKFLDGIFLGCPVLETLKVTYCELDSRKLLISSTQLKNLVIRNCMEWNDPNVFEITVSAPNLVSFSCTDFSNAYHLENLSSLESVDLDITTSYWQNGTEEEDAKRMIKCLQGIYNVKFLKLAASTVKEISKALDILKRPSLLFANLRHLKVSTPITKEYLLAITYILETSLGVETLTICIIRFETNSLNIAEGFPLQPVEFIEFKTSVEDLEFAEGFPLQRVKFIQVKTLVEDLEFVKILLKNAIILEKMTVAIVWQSPHQLKRLTNVLRKCPRASPNAQVLAL